MSRPARVRRKRGGPPAAAGRAGRGPGQAQTLGIDREFRAALRELHSLKGAIDEEERITSRHGARSAATGPATPAATAAGVATDDGANTSGEVAASPALARPPPPAGEAGEAGRAAGPGADGTPASPALGSSPTRERLRLAEGVMRKLYRRNMELERAMLGSGRPGSARSFGGGSEPARPTTSASARTAFVVPGARRSSGRRRGVASLAPPTPTQTTSSPPPSNCTPRQRSTCGSCWRSGMGKSRVCASSWRGARLSRCRRSGAEAVGEAPTSRRWKPRLRGCRGRLNAPALRTTAFAASTTSC